jgi:hypothetical protein
MKGRPLKGGEAPLKDRKNHERRFRGAIPDTHGRAFSVAGKAPTESGDVQPSTRIGGTPVSTTNEKRQGRLGPFLVVVPALVVVGALGFSALGGVEAALIAAGVGLGWSLFLGFIAMRLAQSESRRIALANVSVFVATLGSGLLAGGALLQQLLLSAGLVTPSTTFTMIHPPFGGSFNLFIITLNSLMEWLLIPVALFLNWHIPKRRTLIVTAAAVFYAMRIWTYVYFVPNIFEFGALPPNGPFSAEVVERFRIWVNLSWLRFAIQDALTYLLFLLAAFVPASASGTFRKPAGEKAVEKEAQSA